MKKILLSLFGLICFMITQAQVAKTVNMTQAGTLTSVLTADETTTITDLTLTGPIDARDFKTMRDLMPLLAVLDMEGANIEAYSGIEGTYSPSQTYPANEIPKDAFRKSTYGNKTLKTVKFPSGLTSIGSYAFSSCFGLTGELNLPSGVTSIGERALFDCDGLTGELKLPAGLTSIGDYAFSSCSGLTSIRSYAQTPPQIYYDTFKDTGIKIAFVPTGSKAAYQSANYWSAFSIIDEEKAYTLDIPMAGKLGVVLTNAGGELNAVTSLILTGNLNSDDFLLIRDKMPSLHTLNIEGLSNKSIPNYALKDNKSLLNIELPSGLTSIGERAFSGCNLTCELNLPSDLTSIGYEAFSDCSGLTGELKLPAGLTSISFYAFKNCSGLTGELILPSGLTYIGNGTFQGCSGLTGELILPSVTSIGEYAFLGCHGLTGIHLKRYCSINSQAFSGCSNVSKITCESITPPLFYDAFDSINKKTCKVYVPKEGLRKYFTNKQWAAFENIIEMDIPTENYLTFFLITPGGTVQCNGSDVSNGSKIEIKAGESMKLTFESLAGYPLDQLLYDGEDVTAQVQNNQWTSPAVSKAVTVSVSFKTEQYEIAILTVGSGVLNAHTVESNSTHTIRLAATEGYLIENVTLNGADVTPDLENGKLTLHNITEDQTLVITSKRDGETSEIGVSSDKTIRTWRANGQLFVESIEEMMTAEVVDMSGRTACSISKTAYAYVLNLSSNGVYVVRIRTVNGEVKTVKVAM